MSRNTQKENRKKPKPKHRGTHLALLSLGVMEAACKMVSRGNGWSQHKEALRGRKWDSPLDGTRTHLWHPWVLLPSRAQG